MLRERDGPHREDEESKPMMHGHEKSDLVIVAMKPANKPEGASAALAADETTAAEPVERRVGAERSASRSPLVESKSKTVLDLSSGRSRIRCGGAIRRRSGPRGTHRANTQ